MDSVQLIEEVKGTPLGARILAADERLRVHPGALCVDSGGSKEYSLKPTSEFLLELFRISGEENHEGNFEVIIPENSYTGSYPKLASHLSRLLYHGRVGVHKFCSDSTCFKSHFFNVSCGSIFCPECGGREASAIKRKLAATIPPCPSHQLTVRMPSTEIKGYWGHSGKWVKKPIGINDEHKQFGIIYASGMCPVYEPPRGDLGILYAAVKAGLEDVHGPGSHSLGKYQGGFRWGAHVAPHAYGSARLNPGPHLNIIFTTRWQLAITYIAMKNPEVKYRYRQWQESIQAAKLEISTFKKRNRPTLKAERSSRSKPLTKQLEALKAEHQQIQDETRQRYLNHPQVKRLVQRDRKSNDYSTLRIAIFNRYVEFLGHVPRKENGEFMKPSDMRLNGNIIHDPQDILDNMIGYNTTPPIPKKIKYKKEDSLETVTYRVQHGSKKNPEVTTDLHMFLYYLEYLCPPKHFKAVRRWGSYNNHSSTYRNRNWPVLDVTSDPQTTCSCCGADLLMGVTIGQRKIYRFHLEGNLLTSIKGFGNSHKTFMELLEFTYKEGGLPPPMRVWQPLLNSEHAANCEHCKKRHHDKVELIRSGMYLFFAGDPNA